jgi:hypothetical protein
VAAGVEAKNKDCRSQFLPIVKFDLLRVSEILKNMSMLKRNERRWLARLGKGSQHDIM